VDGREPVFVVVYGGNTGAPLRWRIHAPVAQQNVVALMTEVERMYGNTSRQFREFGEWLAGLTAAIGAVTQKRVEQATAQLNEVDDRIR
jgi:hypothetical protein